MARHPLSERAAQGPASDITIHVRLTDGETEQQQEALGIIGVNLVYGALFHHADPRKLIASLLDNVTAARVEIDMIEFSGPAFDGVDNRLMSLELVQLRPDACGDVWRGRAGREPSDALYKKCVLVERGSFRPATKVTVDMLRCAQAQFVQEPGVQGEDVVMLFEMTLRNLREGARTIDAQDFLDRADILATLGQHGDDLELWRVPPAGGVSLPPDQEADRPRDGRADPARALRREATTPTSMAGFWNPSGGCSRTT